VSDSLPGFEAYEWNGVFVPHGTPAAIVQKLNGALNEALRSPDVKARFEQLNIDSRANTPENSAPSSRRNGAVEPGGEGSEYQAGMSVSAADPPRIAGPLAQPKRPRQAPPPGAWDAHAHIFGPADKFPYTPGAATRRPTRRSRLTSRCSTGSVWRAASWCRAMRMASTTASCSTRWRAIRTGCAASPSPICAFRPQRCATGTSSACAACASICFPTRGVLAMCAASGSTCSRPSAPPCANSAGSCRCSATGG